MWRALTIALVSAALLTPGPAALAAPPTTPAPPTTTAPAPTAPDDDRDEAPPATVPLVPVPPGCAPHPLPYVVFTGVVEERDDRTVRFRIERVRSGRTDLFASRNLIDIRYGLDAKYLEHGETYLVAAVVEPTLGLLISYIEDPVENFGGDEVIGITETDVDCPPAENVAITLHPDGTPVDGGVLKPLLDSRGRLAGALLIPFAVSVAAVFVLAAIRLGLAGVYRGLTNRD